MWLFLLSGFFLVVLTFACSNDSQQKTGRRAKGRALSPPKQTLRSSSNEMKPTVISKGASAESKTMSKETPSKETPQAASIPVVKSKESEKVEEPMSSDVPLRPKAQPPTDRSKTENMPQMNEEMPAKPNLSTSTSQQKARLDLTQKSSRASKKRKASNKSETAKEN